MTMHTAMVRVYCDGTLYNPGEDVDYHGPSDWKYRPVEPGARRQWEATYQDPERIAEMLHQQGAIGLVPTPKPQDRG